MTFAPKGWVSIAGIHDYFSSTITFWLDWDQLAELTIEGADRRGLLAAWECLEAAASVAILGPNGSIIPMEKSLLSSSGYITKKSNFHVHLDIGTLGSGHGNRTIIDQDSDEPMNSDLAQLHYGPFAYCPVLIPRGAYDIFRAEFDKSIQTEAGYQLSEKRMSVVQQIISIAESGRAVRRDDIKRILAKDMKTDEWRAHWRDAVATRPELGKPGPKLPRR